jgi:hypothetical protein
MESMPMREEEEESWWLLGGESDKGSVVLWMWRWCEVGRQVGRELGADGTEIMIWNRGLLVLLQWESWREATRIEGSEREGVGQAIDGSE